MAKKRVKDPDNPGLSKAEIDAMRPAAEVVPAVAAAYRRTRGPQKAPKKIQTTIRLDADIVEHFKRKGRGWQTSINEELRKAVR